MDVSLNTRAGKYDKYKERIKSAMQYEKSEIARVIEPEQGRSRTCIGILSIPEMFPFFGGKEPGACVMGPPAVRQKIDN